MSFRDSAEINQLLDALSIAYEALEQLESLEKMVGNKSAALRNQYVAKEALHRIEDLGK